MSYSVEIRREALEDLRSLDPIIEIRILKKLEWFKENFDILTPEPLKGEFKGLFKLRVGDYRILYTCNNKAKQRTAIGY